MKIHIRINGSWDHRAENGVGFISAVVRMTDYCLEQNGKKVLSSSEGATQAQYENDLCHIMPIYELVNTACQLRNTKVNPCQS